jgi:hypothetical protein
VPRGQAALLQLLEGRAVRFALGGVLGAICAAAIACGAARPPSAAPAAAPEMGRRPEAAPGGDPHDEIAALDREIAAQLSRAQVAPPATAACSGAACQAAMAEPFATPSTTDPACHPQASARCKDVCTLSDSICKNQQRICELASQLVGDDWAAGKCTTARASCQTAHDSCCSCVL